MYVMEEAGGKIHHEGRSTKKEEERHPLISLITPLISLITQIEEEKRRTWDVGRKGQCEFWRKCYTMLHNVTQ